MGYEREEVVKRTAINQRGTLSDGYCAELDRGAHQVTICTTTEQQGAGWGQLHPLHETSVGSESPRAALPRLTIFEEVGGSGCKGRLYSVTRIEPDYHGTNVWDSKAS